MKLEKSVKKWNQELSKISNQPCITVKWFYRLVIAEEGKNSVLQAQLERSAKSVFESKRNHGKLGKTNQILQYTNQGGKIEFDSEIIS